MNIADIDRMDGYSEGFGPIAQALQWLDTLTRAPSVQWSPGQREAAVSVLRDARRVLYSDLIDAARAALGAPSTHVPNVDTTVQGLTMADGGERVGMDGWKTDKLGSSLAWPADTSSDAVGVTGTFNDQPKGGA